MAAGASPAQITAGMRKGLQALAEKLAEKEIFTSYRAGTKNTYPRLLVRDSNVEYAEYKLLRASNGECVGFPRVKFKDEPGGYPGKVYEGWDAFDKITKGG